jgi:predicted RNA-binding Zn-ribbon protein involved in translation (DUF1610 family)
MNLSFKDRLVNMGYRLRQWLTTRYGMDRLSRDLLIGGIVLSLVSRLLRLRLLYSLGTAALLLSVLRSCSPSSSRQKRQRELGIYAERTAGLRSSLKLVKMRLTDRQHKYIRCSSCGKVMRVPKGQGEIVANCPVCGGQTRTRS